jgi:UPF0271 protein
MARDHVVQAIDGTEVPLVVDTICLHSDTPGAADLAERIRIALREAGVAVISVGRATAPRHVRGGGPA